MEHEQLLTRADVSRRLGLSQQTHQTIRTLEKRGLLPRVEISSRCIRYRAADVERLINKTLLSGGAR